MISTQYTLQEGVFFICYPAVWHHPNEEMTDEFSSTLSWFANYSNFYSVMSVLICFCVMVVFILRLNGDQLLSSSSTHYNIVKEQAMVSLHNPFSVQLHKNKTSTLQDGVHLDISVTHQSKVSVVWALNIQAFQKELQLSSTDIASRYDAKNIFDNKYLHIIDCGIVSPAEAMTEVFVKRPDHVTETSLGQPPRQVYPVVVVSILEDCHISLEYTAMVVQFTVLHMKDSVCPLDSHIVYQFVKTNHNSLLSLQPIFVSSSDPDTFGAVHTDSTRSSATSDNSHKDIPGNKNTCEKCEKIRKPENIPHTSEDADHCNCGNVETIGDILLDQTSNETFNLNGIDTVNGARADSGDGEILTDNAHPEKACDIGLSECNPCIVCQNDVIFYTLLPCRHACVCCSCMKLLDRCPMCRGYIDAYFRLHNNGGQHLIQEIDDGHSQGPRLTRWQALNQRLNEMLGFA